MIGDIYKYGIRKPNKVMPMAGTEDQAWNEIDFKKCQAFVDRLQKSIAKAVKYENHSKALTKNDGSTKLRDNTRSNKGAV